MDEDPLENVFDNRDNSYLAIRKVSWNRQQPKLEIRRWYMDGEDNELAKDIAMQAAAMKPLYLDRDEVPAERVEKERAILTEQAENEGLDSNKLPMIVNGRLNKFYEEVCLVDQGFIKENKMKVSKYVESKHSKIISFVRYEVGEGMEKREENFADEVMKQING